MDISKIQSASSIGKISHSKQAQSVQTVSDSISISNEGLNEAEKIQTWVEMLKSMPDFPQTFSRVGESSDIYLIVAEQMLDEF